MFVVYNLQNGKTFSVTGAVGNVWAITVSVDNGAVIDQLHNIVREYPCVWKQK